jgi:hypothetical protein
MPYTGGFPEGTGTKWMRGRYDFAVDGGAVSTITISDENIPANAIILGGVVEVDVAVTSGGAATLAIQVEAAGRHRQRRSRLGRTVVNNRPQVVIPVFTGATTVKTTVARPIQVVIAAAALTAGVVDVLLAYTLMGD